jgi:hypothetical protein
VTAPAANVVTVTSAGNGKVFLSDTYISTEPRSTEWRPTPAIRVVMVERAAMERSAF